MFARYGDWADPETDSDFASIAEEQDARLGKPDLDEDSELFRIWMTAEYFSDEELEPMPDMDRARHERTRVALVEWANGVLANAKERTSEVDAP